METLDTTCTPEMILSVQDQDLAQFVRDQISHKQLSRTMEQLNKQLLSADTEAREMAAKAIERLGFVVDG